MRAGAPDVADARPKVGDEIRGTGAHGGGDRQRSYEERRGQDVQHRHGREERRRERGHVKPGGRVRTRWRERAFTGSDAHERHDGEHAAG